MGFQDPTPTPIPDGPWNSMRDAKSPTTRKKGALRLCQNAYPCSGDSGDAVIGRPGYIGLGTVQLGAGGARTVQGIHQYKKKEGTIYTIAIVGGKFYTVDWATRVWTEVITAANFTTATVTLSSTARIAFMDFANVVIISDGINLPWTWNGAAGAGGVVKLTNAPVIYGVPWMYYGRWMGLKASDRTTFVWSEVLQPNVGFEVGFANAWTLVQTDSSAINLGVGTNDAVTVFRARSSTTATGKPDTNFASQATREGLSESEGSSSPWAYIQTERAVVFLDSDLHAQLSRPGGSLVPLWEDLYQTTKLLPRSSAQYAIAANYRPASLHLFAVCDSTSATEPNVILVYDAAPDIPVPVAIWRGFTMTAFVMADDADGVPKLLHGYNGYIYEHGNPEDAIWDDFDLTTGTTAIDHNIETQALGLDLKRENFFDRLDVSLQAQSEMALDVYTETPRGRSALQLVTVGGGSGVFGRSLFGAATFSTGTQEQHADCGLDGEGRYVVVGIKHQKLGEQFGINALTVTAFPSGSDPSVP